MNASEPVKWRGVFLEPLDVLFFRDGRPFDSTNRVVSVLPTPQTVAGAIRSHWLGASGFSRSKIKNYQGDIVSALRAAGADAKILDARFRGPWLAGGDCANAGARPLLPCPMNLKTSKDDPDRWLVALPTDRGESPEDGWQHADGLWPLEFPSDPDPKFESVLLTPSGFRKYQQHLDLPAAARNGFSLIKGDDYLEPDAIYSTDHRIGIAIDPKSLATIKGELYGIGLLALRPGFGMHIEIEMPDSLAELLDGKSFPFGGEGKCVRACVMDEPIFSPADEPAGQPRMTYLATPTFLTKPTPLATAKTPHRPLPPSGIGTIRGAASDRPLAVSGWDVARGGPRATRFAVPAGAVYFWDGPVKVEGLIGDIPDRDARLQEGWGFAIPANWNAGASSE
ncbi:MAG: type III-B CRISPR module-associated protein Cmr3 [Planctomycetaceae bacterium]|nr:MAG: type III-B CRISPR module-associated protein Cmr3 [Planctomycetaceae bacterium]